MLAPEIRFKNSEKDTKQSEWNEYRLHEVLSISKDKNENKYSSDDICSVSDEYGVVNQIELQGRSFAGADISNYKTVKKNQIIYTRSPLLAKPFGIIKICGNTEGVVSPLYSVNNVKKGFLPEYVYYYFDSPNSTNNYLRPLVRIGAKHTMNITDAEWLSGKFFAPDISEQEKIVDLFSTIDNILEKLREEVGVLERKKRWVAAKLFDTIHSGEHDELKLKDVGKFQRGGTLSKDNIAKSGIPCILYGHLYTEYNEVINRVKYSTAESNVVFGLKNDVLFPTSTTADAVSLISPSSLRVDKVALGGDIIVFRPNDGISGDYLSYYVNLKLKRKIAAYAQGSTIIHIHSHELGEQVFDIPNIDMQRRTVSVLDSFNALVSLKNSKIATIESMKRGLHNKMFIQRSI